MRKARAIMPIWVEYHGIAAAQRNDILILYAVICFVIYPMAIVLLLLILLLGGMNCSYVQVI